MCLAVPGEILGIADGVGHRRQGRVRFGGVVKDVCLVLTPEAGPGDWVMVHAGLAIAAVDRSEARRVTETLDEGFDDPSGDAGP